MTDVLLRPTEDGGEIQFIGGEPTLSDGLESAAFLSLFGGNERDSGDAEGERFQWWANFEEPVADRRLRSKTQSLLKALSAVPYNLTRIEDAAKSDLSWMEAELGAKVTVSASIPDLDRVLLEVEIAVGTTKYNFEFKSNWVVQE